MHQNCLIRFKSPLTCIYLSLQHYFRISNQQSNQHKYKLKQYLKKEDTAVINQEESVLTIQDVCDTLKEPFLFFHEFFHKFFTSSFTISNFSLSDSSESSEYSNSDILDRERTIFLLF